MIPMMLAAIVSSVQTQVPPALRPMITFLSVFQVSTLGRRGAGHV